MPFSLGSWVVEQMSGLQGQGRKSRMFRVFDGHVTIPTATGNGNICCGQIKETNRKSYPHKNIYSLYDSGT